MKHKCIVKPDQICIVRTTSFIVLFGFFVFVILWLASVQIKEEKFKQKITNSIERQGKWFVQNQKEGGDFIYERTVATGEANERNNIVRQAGVIYALAMLYHYNHDSDTQQALEKGFAYFQGLTKIQNTEASSITYNNRTPSNATALLILGLAEYIETDEKHKTAENLEYLVKLSNYLVSTQTLSGAYINNYTTMGPVESDYNNGESMYALMRSYNITQKETYLLSVKRMADYALDYYGKQKFNSSFFSWGMAGFAHLYQINPDDRYWKFLKIYADKYMSGRGTSYEQYLLHKSVSNISPGTSVFLEGVDHIAWIAKTKDKILYINLKLHVQKMLDYLLMYEINSPYGKYNSKSDMVNGAICSQITCETARIDFLQHNVSAILLYMRFL